MRRRVGLAAALALVWLAGLALVLVADLATAWARPTVSPTALLELDHRTALGDGGTEGFAGVTPGESVPRAAFQLARLRTGVRLVEGAVSVQLSGERVDDRFAPLDAFAVWQLAETFRIEAGAMRGALGGPFYHEPIFVQPFSERAAIETTFRQRRELAAGFNWAPASLPLMATFHLGNGSGAEGSQPSVQLLLEGRFGRARSALAEGPWGLWAGVSGQHEATKSRRAVTFNTPFGSTALRPAPVQGARSLADAFAVAWLGPVRLRLEGAYAVERRGLDAAAAGEGQVARTGAAVRSGGLTAELNWVVRGGARHIGRAPIRPAEGPAIEVSARAEWLWFDLDDPRWHQAVSLGSVGVKAWLSDWWAVALVGFGHTGVSGAVRPESGGATGAAGEAGIYLRSSFFYWGASGA